MTTTLTGPTLASLAEQLPGGAVGEVARAHAVGLIGVPEALVTAATPAARVGRPASVVAESLANSVCFGVYAPTGEQVGFARAVTDHATFAWICDVYIARSVRGRGLGGWLAQAATDELHAAGVTRIILATADAHSIYAKAGFTALAEPDRWMEIDLRPTKGGQNRDRDVADS